MVFWVLSRSKARRKWPTLVLFFTEYSNWKPSSNSLSSVWLQIRCLCSIWYKLRVVTFNFQGKEVGGKNITIRTNIIEIIIKTNCRVRVSGSRESWIKSSYSNITIKSFSPTQSGNIMHNPDSCSVGIKLGNATICQWNYHLHQSCCASMTFIRCWKPRSFDVEGWSIIIITCEQYTVWTYSCYIIVALVLVYYWRIQSRILFCIFF